MFLEVIADPRAWFPLKFRFMLFFLLIQIIVSSIRTPRDIVIFLDYFVGFFESVISIFYNGLVLSDHFGFG